MKILLANKFFFLKGGAETVFFQERELLIKQEFAVIDFSMEDERNFPSPFSDYFVPNIDYYDQKNLQQKIRNALFFVHSPVAVRNIERLIAKEKPEIAHLHNIYHQLTPSIIPVLKKHGVKVILTLHDCKLICPSYLALRSDGNICSLCEGRKFWNPFTTNCQDSRLQGFLLSAEALWHKWRGSYNGVDLFLSPSRFIADFTSKRITPDRIKVLHNGIDVNEYQPNYENKGYAIFLGRLSKEKGVTTLLRANKMSSSNFPLKIIGTGPMLDKLNREYPEVEFMGFRSGQELKDLMANAAFIVVPSECYENCSMVVLEAMAMGKPVIGSRIGGIPEQIEDDKTGFLFEMGNAEELAEKMALLRHDDGLKKQMGHAARIKLKQKYSLEEHNRQLLEIYSDLLA